MKRRQKSLIITITIALILISIPFIAHKRNLIYQDQQDFQETSISNSNETIEPPISIFTRTMKEFNWEEWEKAALSNDHSQTIHYSQEMIETLTTFLVLEPIAEINKSCLKPNLTSPAKIDCSQYPAAFGPNATKRATPRKVAHLIQFGFDVDILEIHLHEIYDLVDYIFIIESTHAHFAGIEKPLLWERVKSQSRFSKFKKKIVHMVIDDADSVDKNSFWAMESYQEEQRWVKFLEWNSKTKYFGADDLVGFGDTDEIAWRENIQLLKYCGFDGRSLDIGIWFPFGRIDQAFKPDWPVSGKEFTLGDPTFYTLDGAMKMSDGTPNRMRGKSGPYLLGGIHMTHYGYLPFQLVKHMTATEYGVGSADRIREWANKLGKDNVEIIEREMAQTPQGHMWRVLDVKQVWDQLKDIAKLPWFYDCNRKRYPVWEGLHDPRLDLE